MDNQIWNDDKGEGNAHNNPFRDYRHGRIYIIRYNGTGNDGDTDGPDIPALDANDDQSLLKALQSDNQFWRVTAQRLIVEGKKTGLIPDLIQLAGDTSDMDKNGLNAPALHALWTLDGLGALNSGNDRADEAVETALTSESYAVKRAALALLPETAAGSETLVASGLLTDSDAQVRLAAVIRASQLPETKELTSQMKRLAQDSGNANDKWLNSAIKIFFKEPDYEVDDDDQGSDDEVEPDVVFTLNTVPQEMAFDNKVLRAEAGQTIEIKLNNPDQMPHNLVLIIPGSLDTFGPMVDRFVNDADAEKMGYVPRSRYVLGATEMLDPDESGSIIVKLPGQPGTYPFVCTFPGHWRMMQGEIIVTAPNNNTDA